MANPNINDKELSKFRLSTPRNDVYVATDIQTEDPLATVEWSRNDLELQKFTNTWAVRVVLTI